MSLRVSRPRNTDPAEQLPYLSRSDNFIFRRSQLRQSKGTAAVQFLRADAHLGTETEFSAVGEASGCIPVHGSRIHSAQELAGVRLVTRDDGVAVLGGIAVNVSDCVLDIGDHSNSHAQPQILLEPVLLGRGRNLQSASQAASFSIATHFDTDFNNLLDDAA